MSLLSEELKIPHSQTRLRLKLTRLLQQEHSEGPGTLMFGLHYQEVLKWRFQPFITHHPSQARPVRVTGKLQA